MSKSLIRAAAAALALSFLVALLLPLLAATDPGAAQPQAAAPPPTPSATEGLLDTPGIWEYMPASPNFPRDSPLLREHSVTYTPKEPNSISPTAYSRSLGNHKAIVVLAEFQDIKHQASNTQAHYDYLVNGNASNDRSMRTFYYENSAGNYTLTGTITTWVTLPHDMSWYQGNNGQNMWYLVSDAAAAANSQVDFSQFDENGDDVIDNFIIVHAGNDQALTNNANDIWSHAGAGYYTIVDGKYAQRYCTVAEEATYGSHLGALVHEFGHHGLNLPDLYDVDYRNAGLGDWDTMSAGAYGGGGYAPNGYSAWSKFDLGWIDPYVPAGAEDGYTIFPMTNTGQRNPVKIESNYTNEYFLVEFRNRDPFARYDSYLPTSGLVIYHVDSTVVSQTRLPVNRVETDTAHKGIDIEEVGTQDMDLSWGNQGNGNDVWVGNPTGFTPTSSPNSNLYANGGTYVTGIKVYNISAVLTSGGPHITFSLDTGRVNYGLTGRVLNGAQGSALPAATATYRVQFSTLASSGDTVTLAREGPDAALGSLDATVLNLPAFGSQTVNLSVTMPGGCLSGESADVQVRATSTAPAGTTFVVPTITLCAQAYAITVTGPAAFNATPTANLTQDYMVHNAGNGADNVTLSAVFDPALIDVEVMAQPYAMARGADVLITLRFMLMATVPYGTLVPVSLDALYGPTATGDKGVPIGTLRSAFALTISTSKLSLLVVQVQAPQLQRVDPGKPLSLNLTVHNDGNYLTPVTLTASIPAGFSLTFSSTGFSMAAFSVQTVAFTLTADAATPAWSQADLWFYAATSSPPMTGVVNHTFLIAQRFELALGGDASASALPGANLVLNLVAVNLGNGVDHATAWVSPAFSEWNVSLYRSNFTLTTSSTDRQAAVYLRVTVPASAAGSTLQEFLVTLVSENGLVSVTHRVTILVLPVFAFNVTVESASGAISGSQTATFLISFRNLGNVRDSYSITVAGLPDGWGHELVEGGVATVLPRFTGLMTLVVTPATAAGAATYNFQIFATSEGDLAQRKILLERVVVAPHRQLQIVASSVDGEVKPGSVVTIHLIVRNLGNVEEQLTFETAAGGAFKSVGFDPFQVSVRPYEEVAATAIVLLRDDQASGYLPVEIRASSITNTSLSAEETVGINVAKATTQAGFSATDAAIAAGAVAAACVGAAVLSRWRR